MKNFFLKRCQKEHRRWLAAMALCVLTAWVFSNEIEKKSLTYPIFHPFEFLKNRMDNSFSLIFTIFKPNDMFDSI
jgi:hypothetical protein